MKVRKKNELNIKKIIVLAFLAAIFVFTPVVSANADEDLGDGFYLLDSDIDPLSTVVIKKISQEQFDRLSNPNFYSVELQAITNSIYAKFKREFDFLNFAMDIDDDTRDAIVDKLGFAAVFSNTGGKLGSMFSCGWYSVIRHEICHNWVFPHWGISNANGVLGGFGYIRTVELNSGGIQGKTKYQASERPNLNPDGSFVYGFSPHSSFADKPYSDIELCSMGMKSVQALRDSNFRLDVYTGISDSESVYSDGYFCATGVQSYTIDDLVAMNSQNYPNINTSQKHFKILTIILSKDGNRELFSKTIRYMQWFAGSIDAEQYEEGNERFNFAQATYGVGSLEVVGVKNSLRNTGGDDSNSDEGVGCNSGVSFLGLISLVTLAARMKRR